MFRPAVLWSNCRLADGKVIWKTLENGEGMMSSGAFSSPTIATIADKRQLVVQTREELCGVDLETGDVLWKQPIEAFRGMNILDAAGDRRSRLHVRSQREGTTVRDPSDGRGRLASRTKSGCRNRKLTCRVRCLIGDSIFLHLKNQRVTSLSALTDRFVGPVHRFGKYWSMVSNGDQILALDNGGDLLLIQASDSELAVHRSNEGRE